MIPTKSECEEVAVSVTGKHSEILSALNDLRNAINEANSIKIKIEENVEAEPILPPVSTSEPLNAFLTHAPAVIKEMRDTLHEVLISIEDMLF